MTWLKSLLVTSIIGFGIALVMWLVSLMTGESEAWISGILVMVFGLLWFWVHRGINDPELNPGQQQR